MDKLKKFLPDALAVVLFIAIGLAYFFVPVTQGLVLAGHDHSAGLGAGVEMQEYQARTGERTRWTNAIFSGMPTYQMAPSYDSTDTLKGLERVYELGLTGPVAYVFVMLLGFYILLRAFNFKVWMAALGAVLWAFSSYFFIIIGAGHIWKVMALAYIPPTLAGMVWCYRGKRLWGAWVTAFFMALQIMSNHVQMSYYFVPVMGLMAIAFLIEAVKEKKVAQWGLSTCIVAVACAVGVAVNASNLYHTYEYSKESMRAGSELTYKKQTDPGNHTKDGLERDYITQWSYGLGETWTLLVPNVKGGASQPLTESRTAMDEANPQYTPVYRALGQYWGEQPGTSGPVYVGVLVLMLAVLAMFVVRGPMKWALLLLTVLSVMLSWGRNFMGLTDFFLDYVPMYAKFRAVASILVVAEFTIPLLAMLGLKEIVERPEVLKGRPACLYTAFALTGGISLLFALAPDVCFGNYVSSSEMSMLEDATARGYIPGEMLPGLLANLHEMRQAVVVADAWRSFIIAAVGLALLWLYRAGRIRSGILAGGIAVVCLIDLWQVDKRYLNDGMFSTPTAGVARDIPKTAADEAILRDPDPYYRVMNLAGSPFNENNTSFYHKSIGGYHAAKLRRYQEMIEEHIAPEMGRFARAVAETGGNLAQVDGDTIFPVLNMLNVKYAIMAAGDGRTLPVENPHAAGNAWFVDEVRYVADADSEILGLHDVNPRHVALVGEDFRAMLDGAEGKMPADSTRRVRLTKYDANALEFEVESAGGGVVVFSDIYYPGWQAWVDGEEADIVRADYVLRAMRMPAGHHVVTMKFDPKSLRATEATANGAMLALLVGLLALLGREAWRRRKASASDAARPASSSHTPDN